MWLDAFFYFYYFPDRKFISTACDYRQTTAIGRVFSVPVLGEQFTLSILVLDYSVIMGITLYYRALFILVVLIILIIDILYGFLDQAARNHPRHHHLYFRRIALERESTPILL